MVLQCAGLRRKTEYFESLSHGIAVLQEWSPINVLCVRDTGKHPNLADVVGQGQMAVIPISNTVYQN